MKTQSTQEGIDSPWQKGARKEGHDDRSRAYQKRLRELQITPTGCRSLQVSILFHLGAWLFLSLVCVMCTFSASLRKHTSAGHAQQHVPAGAPHLRSRSHVETGWIWLKMGRPERNVSKLVSTRKGTHSSATRKPNDCLAKEPSLASPTCAWVSAFLPLDTLLIAVHQKCSSIHRQEFRFLFNGQV